jgi:hypothetical protein
MTLVIDIALLLVGASIVIGTLGSAVRTVVIPRAAFARLTRVIFFSLRWILIRLARGSSDDRTDSILALNGPLGLLVLPLAWSTGIILGFGLVYMATSDLESGTALVLSGSSFTTLGFARPELGIHQALAIIESLLGLGVIALLIAYLPSIYSTFSQREVVVADVLIKSGGVATGPSLIARHAGLGCLDRLDGMWDEWERWFIELGESHTSEPSLNFLRSPSSNRSWLTTAVTILDAAALRNVALDLPISSSAEMTHQAGVEALTQIGTFFGTEKFDPSERGPGLERSQFEAGLARMAAAGAPSIEDRAAAWEAFARRRREWDTYAEALDGLIMPPAPRRFSTSDTWSERAS